MAADDDLIVKADSLMRRRTFVAGGAQPAAELDADDLPVLTEVVAGPLVGPAALPPPTPERIEALARELIHERLPAQRQLLAAELDAWLDAELPQVVMRVLDGVTDLIVARVTEEARAALLPRLQAALEVNSQPSQDGGAG